MKRLLFVLKFVAVPLVVGYISMLLQRESMENWYPMLAKSSLTPPGIVFSIMWTILYVLMGVSAAIVWSKYTSASRVLKLLYSLQLFLNFMWSFCFFFLRMPLLAFFVIIALILVVATYVAGCYVRHRLAAYLNFPYLLWLLFAAYLNGYVVICN
jgi:tryptophan-rich sensory protein